MTTGGTPAAGTTVWLTGPPSAGKSTIARRVAATLDARGRQVQALCPDLRIDTQRMSVDAAADLVLSELCSPSVVTGRGARP